MQLTIHHSFSLEDLKHSFWLTRQGCQTPELHGITLSFHLIIYNDWTWCFIVPEIKCFKYNFAQSSRSIVNSLMIPLYFSVTFQVVSIAAVSAFMPLCQQLFVLGAITPMDSKGEIQLNTMCVGLSMAQSHGPHLDSRFWLPRWFHSIHWKMQAHLAMLAISKEL